MSWANVMMYLSVLPSYNDKKGKDKKEEHGAVIRADDKNNQQQVRQILFG